MRGASADLSRLGEVVLGCASRMTGAESPVVLTREQYPPVREAKPNPNHIYVAALQALGLAPNLITQNVSRVWRR